MASWNENVLLSLNERDFARAYPDPYWAIRSLLRNQILMRDTINTLVDAVDAVNKHDNNQKLPKLKIWVRTTTK